MRYWIGAAIAFLLALVQASSIEQFKILGVSPNLMLVLLVSWLVVRGLDDVLPMIARRRHHAWASSACRRRASSCWRCCRSRASASCASCTSSTATSCSCCAFVAGCDHRLRSRSCSPASWRPAACSTSAGCAASAVVPAAIVNVCARRRRVRRHAASRSRVAHDRSRTRRARASVRRCEWRRHGDYSLAARRRTRWRSEHAGAPPIPEQQSSTSAALARCASSIARSRSPCSTVQLARLQLVNGDEYEQRAALNQLRIEPIVPSRGVIYDRNGVPVVENIPSFSAAVVAADVPEDQQLEIVGGLETLLGVPALETSLKIDGRAQVERSRSRRSSSRTASTRTTAFHLREQLADCPACRSSSSPCGATPAARSCRTCSATPAASTKRTTPQLKDQRLPRQRPHRQGRRRGRVRAVPARHRRPQGDREGRPRPRDSARSAKTPAIPGNDLVLSHRPRPAEEGHGAHAGRRRTAARPPPSSWTCNTGEVLALVSLPMYDNNIFSGKIDEATLEQYLNDPEEAARQPRARRAVRARLDLQADHRRRPRCRRASPVPGTTITSNGYIHVPNQYDPSIVYTFKDWRTLGTLDFYGGVAMSSDVYFYYLAGGYHAYGQNFNGLGIDRLARYARQFGLGRQTGIDIAGEADGIVPDAAWKEETFGATPGCSATPTTWASARASSRRRRSRWCASSPPSPTAARCSRRASSARCATPKATSSCPHEPKIEGTVGVSAENLAIVRDAMRRP